MTDTVLVTGGAGFLGTHVVARLLADGHRVVVLDNLSAGQQPQVDPRAQLVVADIVDPAVVETVAAIRPDVVVHAAAQVSVATSMDRPELDRAVNLVGTQNVIDGARRADARRFVFVSSGGAIYGESSGATEAEAPDPLSYYAIHKYAAEVYVRLAIPSFAIARPSNI
jgi:UDP-glucose 4-epimerase